MKILAQKKKEISQKKEKLQSESQDAPMIGNQLEQSPSPMKPKAIKKIL